MINDERPLLRGHSHQAAFFAALGACAVLMTFSQSLLQFSAAAIYSLSLCTLLGVSALYHRKFWNPVHRARMRRLDHASIFILIGGTATPVCLLGLQGPGGLQLLTFIWVAVVLGILQSAFWVSAPKWISVLMYLAVGWLALPYLVELREGLGNINLALLAAGGLTYSLGALIYAVKRPNPWPGVFAYHELFHLLVIVAAAFHFFVIGRLMR